MWWHYLLVFIVYAWPALALHELSHWFTYRVLYDHPVLKIKFYPHKFPSGRWTLGAVYPAKPRPEGSRSDAAIAPIVESCTTFTAWILLGALAWPPLLACCAWEVLDVGNWLRQYIWGQHGDGARWRKERGREDSGTI